MALRRKMTLCDSLTARTYITLARAIPMGTPIAAANESGDHVTVAAHHETPQDRSDEHDAHQGVERGDGERAEPFALIKDHVSILSNAATPQNRNEYEHR